MQLPEPEQSKSIFEALYEQLLQLLNVIPALMKGIVILFIGILLAKLIRRLIRRILGAIGVDKIADRLMSIDLFENSKFNLVPSTLIATTTYYFILIIFAMAAVEAMGLQIISDLLRDFIDYIPNGVTAFLILVTGIFIADAVKKLIKTTCHSLGITSGNLIANVVFYFIMLNIVLIALRQAKLQTEFMEDNISIILAGVAAAFAIGYGLASKDVMTSLLAGFYSRDKFHIGDEVTIDGKRGEVITINNNNIILRSDESEHVVPFSKVTSEGVEIHTRRDKGPALPPHEG